MNEYKCTLLSHGIEYDYFITESKAQEDALKYAGTRFKNAYPHVTDQIITIEKWNQS